MRCAICDKVLSSEEIKFNRDHNDWDPCSHCLMVISEVFEEAGDEEVFEYIYEEEQEDTEEVENTS
jgi:hypothetical protein